LKSLGWLGQLRKGDRCPSELSLDRLVLGECGAIQRIFLRRHVQRCSQCLRDVAMREKGLLAFPELDARAVVERLHEKLSGTELPGSAREVLESADPAHRSVTSGSSAWLATPRMVFGAAVLLLVLGLFLQWRSPRGGDDPAVRSKGALAFEVFRERGEEQEQVESGGVFLPGDRLRFGVHLPRAGHLMIVGVEKTGRVYPCFPTGGDLASRPTATLKDGVLPGAILLDESQGAEWLYLVLCSKPFSLSGLRASASGALSAPDECAYTRFLMNKQLIRP